MNAHAAPRRLTVVLATLAAGILSLSAASSAHAACPNEAIREAQRSTFLPDCRAYEMVSPPDKNGGDILADSGRTRAAEDGNAAMFSSLSAFGDALGTGVASDYVSVRSHSPDPGNGGWSTHGVTPPQAPVTFLADTLASEPTYQLDASADLSKGLVRTWSPLTNAPNVADARDLYLRTDLLTPGAGTYQLINNCLSPPEGPCASPLPAPLPPFALLLPQFRPWVAGTSADFSHVIFETALNLTNGASGLFSSKLYEWDHGTLRLAGILPDSACGSPPCLPTSSVAGQGAAVNPAEHYTPHTISSDGRRIFFTANPQNAACAGYECGDLYMRVDNGTPAAESVQLNASERTDCADHDPCSGSPEPDSHTLATYWDASVDGSRVFFTSSEALTDDAPVNGERKLYMYDTTKPASDAHNLTLLNVEHEPGDAPNDTAGVLGTSDDGHYVYFMSSGQIVRGQPLLGLKVGIYLWHDGQVSYIGEMNDDSNVSVNVANDFSALGTRKRARVSDDGQVLLFFSTDGTGLLSPPYEQRAQSELYVYRAGTPVLSCASCRQDGVAASGDADDMVRTNNGAASTTTHLTRALSDDGRFVFFDTGEALVPADVNGIHSHTSAFGGLGHRPELRPI